VANAAEAGLLERARGRLSAAARAAGRAQATALLTLAYWLVLGPAAMLARLLGADPLARRRPAKSGWIERAPRGARETLKGAG
jgi:hypothetical protein